MLDGASRMGQPLPDCPPESWLSTVSSCGAVKTDEGSHGLPGQGSRNRSGGDLTAPDLRPPPLFRALGQRGPSSTSLPPHRRLRSMFHRPRAVLPDSGHHGLSSWKDSSSKLFTFWDAQVSPADGKEPHSNSVVETSTPDPPESSIELPDKVVRKRILLRACSHPEVPTDDDGRGFAWERETRSFSLTGIKTEVPPQWCSEGPGTCCPGRGPTRGRGWRSSSVCPESWSQQQSSWRRRERQQADKVQRKRRSGGRQRDPHASVAASVAPEGRWEEAGLCQWLQSLGFGEEQKDPPMANRRRRAGDVTRPCFEERLGGRRGWIAESDVQQTHQRRDRRPHFLPPIPQSTATSSSLLYVPLLLPENSPPPSRCASPESPCSPLPVPLLTHIPIPPRKRRDFKTIF